MGVGVTAELFYLNEELTRVDKLLDDERFFAPFRERFGTTMGRADNRCVHLSAPDVSQVSLRAGLRGTGKRGQ